MKCEMLPSKFIPQQVTILLETVEEAKAFRHLVGCWNSPAGYAETLSVTALVEEILEIVESLPV